MTILFIGGIAAGVLAGLLGIGGGALIVPLLVGLGYSPTQAVATSSWAMIITSSSGTLQNWRMGLLDRRQLLSLGIPAVLATQIGVAIAIVLPKSMLLIAFGLLMLLNLYLLDLRQRLAADSVGLAGSNWSPRVARTVTGGIAGAIAGLLGVGGGAIMVPLQMLLLGESIKPAIQTSLGVVVLAAIASTVGHALNGNVIWGGGAIVGVGGLLGAQVSTRLLPRLPEPAVVWLFRLFLVLSAIYSFWKAGGNG